MSESKDNLLIGDEPTATVNTNQIHSHLPTETCSLSCYVHATDQPAAIQAVSPTTISVPDHVVMSPAAQSITDDEWVEFWLEEEVTGKKESLGDPDHGRDECLWSEEEEKTSCDGCYAPTECSLRCRKRHLLCLSCAEREVKIALQKGRAALCGVPDCPAEITRKMLTYYSHRKLVKALLDRLPTQPAPARDRQPETLRGLRPKSQMILDKNSSPLVTETIPLRCETAVLSRSAKTSTESRDLYVDQRRKSRRRVIAASAIDPEQNNSPQTDTKKTGPESEIKTEPKTSDSHLDDETVRSSSVPSLLELKEEIIAIQEMYASPSPPSP